MNGSNWPQIYKWRADLKTILQDIFPSVSRSGHIEIGVRLENGRIFGFIRHSMPPCPLQELEQGGQQPQSSSCWIFLDIEAPMATNQVRNIHKSWGLWWKHKWKCEGEILLGKLPEPHRIQPIGTATKQSEILALPDWKKDKKHLYKKSL